MQSAESPDGPRKVRTRKELKRRPKAVPRFRPERESGGNVAESGKRIAARLLKRVRRGKLVFSNRRRDTNQIRQMAESGVIEGPDGEETALSIHLLRTLDRLTARCTAKKPLVINSLYRPLSAGRPREPHGHGLAIDIGAYAGHRILSSKPDSCAAAALSIIKALGPGRYRMGLPRPAVSESNDYRPDGDRAGEWPFFPPPQAVVMRDRGNLQSRARDRRRGIRRTAVTIRWALHQYAPLEEVGSIRVRRAIESAIDRGANIHGLFPDGVNHIHLDVRANH